MRNMTEITHVMDEFPSGLVVMLLVLNSVMKQHHSASKTENSDFHRSGDEGEGGVILESGHVCH